MRHSLKRFNNVFEQVEESELEDWPMEIIQTEEQKEKIRMNRAQESLGTLSSILTYA